MILDTLTKTVTLVLGEAHVTTPCDVTASWGEHAVDVFLPGGASLVTNGTTPVLVVDAPVAAATQRLVQEITLHNNDTVPHTVFLRLVDGANTRVFRRAVVPVNGDFTYAPSLSPAASVDLSGYAPLASPTFTGTPAAPTVAPTAAAGTTQLATTQFVRAGTTTNDNALAGQVGEYVSSTVLVGAAVALTSNTPANIASISLTAGDWDVYGIVLFTTSANNLSQILAWTSTTTAALPTAPNNGGYSQTTPGAAGLLSSSALTVGRQRISLSATTTVYLSAQCSFASGTATGYGFVGARRVR